LPRKP